MVLQLASLLYQRLTLLPSPSSREACLLADVSFTQNAISYKGKQEKSHTRSWTPALRSLVKQVYIPLSQQCTRLLLLLPGQEKPYSQGQLLSEVPFALGNTRAVGNSERASLSVAGIWQVSNQKNLLTSPKKKNGPGWRRQDLCHINKAVCQFQPY